MRIVRHAFPRQLNRHLAPGGVGAPQPRRRIGTTPVALLCCLPLLGAAASAQSSEEQVRAAVESYNRTFVGRDLPALRALLAPDIVLYEHSVKNIGLDDVWENHLRPEVEAFEGTKAEFTDVRVHATADLALVTRQYAITATMRGRPIDARGNETMVWTKRDGAWKVLHIHYSHPCPRPAGTG